MAEGRSAQSVINAAIRENSGQVRLGNFMGVTTMMTGVAIVIWGMANNQVIAVVGGGIVELFFLQAMSMTNEVRRENQRLRVLEIPLARSKTAEEAVEIMRDMMPGKSPQATKKEG